MDDQNNMNQMDENQPQQDSSQQPFGQQPYNQQPPEPKKNTKAPLIIGISVVLVLVLATVGLVLGGVIGGGRGTAAAGEARLTSAIQAWQKSMENGATYLPDFSKFSGKPVETDFKIGLDYIDPYYLDSTMSMLMGSSLDMGIKYDRAGKQMDALISVLTPYMNFEGNEIFISKDMIAIAIPFLFKDPQYVTLNPSTFIKDWNRSPYGMYSPMDEDIDVPEIIAGLFSTGFQGSDRASMQVMGVDMSKFEKDIMAISKELGESYVFSDDGEVSISINGQKGNYTRMSYTVPADAFDQYYLKTLDVYQAFLTDYMKVVSNFNMDSNYTYYGMESTITDVFDVLEQIIFEYDLTINYYLNVQNEIVRIDIPKFSFSVQDTYSDEVYDVQLDFFMDMYKDGSKNKMFGELSVTSDDETIALRMERTNEASDKLIEDVIYFDVLENGEATGTMSINYQWDKAVKDKENMWLVFEVYDDSSSFAIDLKGALAETATDIRWDNGSLTIKVDDETLVGLSVTLGVKAINGSEVGIDTSNTQDFFDFDISKLLSVLSSFLY